MQLYERPCKLAVILASLIWLTSCGGGRPSVSELPPSPVTITYITSAGNSISTSIIRQLAEEYSALHPHVTFKYEETGNADLSKKIQLLAASNDLPVMFSYPAGKPLEDLIESGAVLDLETTLSELGMSDILLPSAVSLMKNQVENRGLYAMPLEMNLEGFWYNKEHFAELGLAVPQTWDEMMAAAAKMMEEGIQPFALAGREKWPITRYMNAYIIRKLGIDAMKDVNQGNAKLTDKGFVEAAQMIKEMAGSGYFGPSPSRVSFGEATKAFMQGKIGMFYSGSWSLRDFDKGSEGSLKPSSIGFFGIPSVENGSSKAEDYPVNAGLTTAFSKEAFDGEVGEWMKYVFERYGQLAMDQYGMITGFRVDRMPDAASPLAHMVQDKLAELKRGALWFEARFTTEEQLAAWDNAQLLISDPDYSGAMYMRELQEVIDGNRTSGD
ncbi:ABC transporter substrate-binding protein [Paenibacillus sp. strain BS8-2]